MNASYTLLLCIFVSASAFASRNLKSSANLHPLDTFTADTYKKGEWSYAQPPIPTIGYSFYGITDRLTAQLDYAPWLGGVPALNFRYLLTDSESDFKISAETMYLYLPDKIDDLDKNNEHIYIKREGSGGFLRFNSTYKMTENTRLHFSLGYSYSDYLKITNLKRSHPQGREFEKLYDPVAMIGFNWFISDSLLFVTHLSYGETWMFFENRPRKEQFTYGFKWAPYPNDKSPFWGNLSIDLIAFYVRFKDADESFLVPLPIFPVFEWQWQG